MASARGIFSLPQPHGSKRTVGSCALSTTIFTLSVLGCAHINAAAASRARGSQPSISEEIKTTLAKGTEERNRGHFAHAEAAFEEAASLAHTAGDTSAEAEALIKLSSCRGLRFRYRAALEAAEEAYSLTTKIKDNTAAGRAATNIASIYAQLGDMRSARKSAQDAVDFLRSCRNQIYLVHALLVLGEIRSQQLQLDSASALYKQAISISKSAQIRDLNEMAWTLYGGALLDADRIQEAESALREAYRLESISHNDGLLAITRSDLAELRYKEGRYQQALKLLRISLASHSAQFSSVRPYWPVELKGKILLALGKQSESLADFREALELAAKWREGALPADATTVRTVADLQEIYQNYASLAATMALERHDPSLAVKALEALIQNRAAGLVEQIRLSLSRSGELPPEYFDILSEIEAVQASVTLREKQEDRAQLDQLRFRLIELDNKIGIRAGNPAFAAERTLHRTSVRDIQLKLNGSEILLSFCLGKDESFLWAVTKDRVQLYKLAAEADIAKEARAFSTAVRDSSDLGAPGRTLSNELFGKLDQTALQKPNWLIVADGALLDGVPLSALPAPAGAQNELLTARHSLRFLSSESLLAFPQRNTVKSVFLGIGDPIYNLFDSRRQQTRSVHGPDTNFPISLARLVDSRQEVRSAAKLSGLPQADLLLGTNASIAGIRKALQNNPEIIHFAVHVVSPEGRPEEAGLALSLASNQMPELLTSEMVETLRLAGSLVVLSGCSSQQGENLPGAGVIGLSRAWLLAGASVVLVSAWPTPDYSGVFFNSFYSHLHVGKATESLPQRAADALRLAQLDMQSKRDYRKSPSFWAAYSIISTE